jgi:hypothetical protein
LARRALISAMVIRSRGATGGTGSASASLAAVPKASEQSCDVEWKYEEHPPGSRRVVQPRRPLSPEWSGAEADGGRPRRAPVRMALRISAGAERNARSGAGLRNGANLEPGYRTR